MPRPMPCRASIDTRTPSHRRFWRTIMVNPEPLALMLGERQTDESPPVRRHEIDVLGRTLPAATRRSPLPSRSSSSIRTISARREFRERFLMGNDTDP
jgi:hypothetical protein